MRGLLLGVCKRGEWLLHWTKTTACLLAAELCGFSEVVTAAAAHTHSLSVSPCVPLINPSYFMAFGCCQWNRPLPVVLIGDEHERRKLIRFINESIGNLFASFMGRRLSSDHLQSPVMELWAEERNCPIDDRVDHQTRDGEENLSRLLLFLLKHHARQLDSFHKFFFFSSFSCSSSTSHWEVN